MVKFELATGEKVLCTICDKFTIGDTGKRISGTPRVVWLGVNKSRVNYVYCDTCHTEKGDMP